MYKHKRLLVALALVLVAPLFLAGVVQARPSCSLGFLCYWDSGSYTSVDDQDGITLRWLDKPTYNFSTGNGTVTAGETVNIEAGYFSADPTNDKIITWLNIPGGNNVLQSMNASTGGYADVNSCFNVLAGGPPLPNTPPTAYIPARGSPYRNNSWASASGGTVMCKYSAADKPGLEASGWTGDVTSGGSSAAWLKNGESTSANSRTYQLSMTIRPDAAGKTFCMRNHVSVTPNDVSFPLTTAQVRNGALRNLVAVSGHKIGNGDAMCFNVQAAKPIEPKIVAGCNTTTVTNPGNWISPAGTPFETQTLVIITDSGGNTLVNEFVGNGQTRTFNYEPKGRDVTVNTARERKNASGNWNRPDPLYVEPATSTTKTCYSASCTMKFGPSPELGGANGVIGGQSFFAYATITNTGELVLKDNIEGTPFELRGNGNWGFATNFAIDKGQTADVPIGDFTAPRGVQTANLSATLGYGGRATLDPLASCATGLGVFERYDLGASASSSYDTENPTEVTFITGAKQGGGTDVNSPFRRAFFKQNGASLESLGPEISDNANFGDTSETDYYDVPPGTVKRGDTFCASIVIERGHGWRGPGEQYVNERGEQTTNCNPLDPKTCAELGLYCGGCPPGTVCCPPATNCSPPPPSVQDKPYVRFYGNDVSVGGGFAPNCGAAGPTSSGIFAFIRPIQEHAPDDKSGSGSQLAAMARGDIRGFVSASLRSDLAPKLPPWSPRGLTFANTNPPSAAEDTVDPILGGGMPAANSNCAPNYFDETQFPDTDPRKDDAIGNSLNIGPSLTTDAQSLRIGNLDITASPSYNKRHTVYVDGNVTIRNNIAYTTTYGPIIPNFTLVVRGNIYIDKSVNQLDGLYIAQPNSSAPPNTTGRIYTCTTGGVVPTSPSDLYNCGADANATDSCADTPAIRARQLVVNGAFIAERVVLNRTVYSLRCSFFKEDSNTAYGPRASKASEIFRFSPEMYLSPSVFSPRATSTSGEYDYITTLPPTL